MPVPADQIAAMLGPMRDQLAQAERDGAAEVAAVDLAAATQALDDMGAWSTQLAADNAWLRFTEPFTRALSKVGQAKHGGAPAADGSPSAMPDDATMLANTVAAYEAAISNVAGTPDEARIVPILVRIIDLGRSGLTYPAFLRELEVQGLTQVMLGLAVPPREQLLADAIHHHDQRDRSREGQANALVALRDELAARNVYGAIDPLEWELGQFRIWWHWAPQIVRDDWVVERVQHLFFDLVDWLDAFTPSAPHDERYAGDNAALTRENIERVQECYPGFLRVRLELLAEGFGLDFESCQADETFPRARLHLDPYLSDARIELANLTLAHCVPGGRPPEALVTRAEMLLRA
jgi:hypothetical protein